MNKWKIVKKNLFFAVFLHVFIDSIFVQSYLKYVIFISHFDSPTEFVTLSFIENFLDWNLMFLAPEKEREKNEKNAQVFEQNEKKMKNLRPITKLLM